VATAAEAAEVAAALPAYRGTGQMTLQNRFFPATQRAKQLIDDGFLGKILGFRAAYLHAGSADPAAPLKWKLSAARGGGVIADLGSHVLDLVQHLLGDYAALSALTQIAFADRPSATDPKQRVPVDAEDCVLMLARMQSGAVGTLEASKLATGAEDEMRVEIHGSQGALRFNGMDAHHLEAFDARPADQPLGGLRGWTRIDTGQRYAAPASGFPGPKLGIGWLRSHAACLANFLQAVAEGRPGNPGLDQGIKIQRLMDAAQRSAKSRAWVEMGE
jgi:predicted dehydrogenase